MIDQSTLTYLILGAFAAGFVNGLAGFGTSLFALGFWLQVLPPVQAVAISLVVSVLTGLQGAWIVRNEIMMNLGRLARFTIPALFCIPFGVATLAYIDPRVLKLIIAGFLILYGGFFMARRSLPNFDRPTRIADISIGAAGGFLGGLAGLSGALPAMWVALRPWPRHVTRAVLQPFNVVVLFVSAIVLAVRGAYSTDTLTALAIAAPIALIASQIGIFVFKRMNDTTFRWLLIGLMFVSGIGLFMREIS